MSSTRRKTSNDISFFCRLLIALEEAASRRARKRRRTTENGPRAVRARRGRGRIVLQVCRLDNALLHFELCGSLPLPICHPPSFPVPGYHLNRGTILLVEEFSSQDKKTTLEAEAHFPVFLCVFRSHPKGPIRRSPSNSLAWVQASPPRQVDRPTAEQS